MKKIFYSIVFIFLSVSCTSNLDLDIAKQLDIYPILETDILYFDIYNNNLIDSNGAFKQQIIDTVGFSVFKDEKIRDSYIKAEIVVAYKNSFNRQFDVEFNFIDDNNQPVETGSFLIDAASRNTDEVSGEHIFIFNKDDNPSFVNFRKIVVKIEINPTIIPVENKKLHIQSKGIFYSKITIE